MRIKRENVKWYVADFETTSLNEYEKTNSTRVWLYSICDSDSNIVEDGDSIDKFMEFCKAHHGALIYFHNLKFDGTFIVSWLLSNGFGYEESLLSHSKKGFSTLIGDLGEWYQIKVNFAPNKQVIFYDSLKLIPLSVRQIAKSFGLPIQKEIIDYSVYEINETTLSYVHNDVKIVAMALKYFRDKGYNRMTIGSNAYHSFKDGKENFNSLFPRLDKEWIQEWRSAYRGGRSQVNPAYANKILHNVRRYDLNSMYPSIMAYKPLPYGRPIECSKPGCYKFELYNVSIHFVLKKGHLPTLLKTSGLYNKAGETYYTDSEGIINLYISNIDMSLLIKHYDIYYLKYNKILGFNTSSFMFRDWVLQMYENKSKHTGGLRLVYKLLLNSLYGKFGSRPEGKNKIPFFDEEGVVQFMYSEDHDMGNYYLPVAIAITSWAHKIIDDAIMVVGYENFVYCDTDSVHTFSTMPDNMVDNLELGKFKLEGIEDTCKYIRQKTYIFKEVGSDKFEITCAGMAYGIREYLNRYYGEDVINVFALGLTVDEHSEGINPNELKLLPLRVKGGTILHPVPFTLR